MPTAGLLELIIAYSRSLELIIAYSGPLELITAYSRSLKLTIAYSGSLELIIADSLSLELIIVLPVSIAVKEVLKDSSFKNYFQFTTMDDKNMTITIPAVEAQAEDTTMYDIYNMLTNERIYAIHISHKFDEVSLNFTVSGKEIEKPGTCFGCCFS